MSVFTAFCLQTLAKLAWRTLGVGEIPLDQPKFSYSSPSLSTESDFYFCSLLAVTSLIGAEWLCLTIQRQSKRNPSRKKQHKGNLFKSNLPTLTVPSSPPPLLQNLAHIVNLFAKISLSISPDFLLCPRSLATLEQSLHLPETGYKMKSSYFSFWTFVWHGITSKPCFSTNT